MPEPTSWTTPAGLRDRLRRRWDRGELLTAWAAGTPWEVMSFPLRGPAADDLSEQLDAVRTWAAGWDAAARRGWRVEYAGVGGRRIGRTELPARAWLDSYDAVWAILGVADDVRRFRALLDRTTDSALAGWAGRRPLVALEHEQSWDRLGATVDWVAATVPYSSYLRQIDVPGADTKFIENHRAVLAELLDLRLSERLDPDAPRTDLAARYRMAGKPPLVRLRMLDGGQVAGFTDLTLRVDELAERPLPVDTVYIVENELTFLAFPDVPNAAAIFGGGYAVPRVGRLPWLARCDVNYWGDLDTHGFAILDRLRHWLPRAKSILMDRTTLLDHEHAWVREPTPTRDHLARLTPEESALYRDLAEDLYAPAVRLEQERIPFPTALTSRRSWT